ncbi:MAG: hypothetical protein LBJ94_00910 [Puniceicoccales bacterium]|jgi:hypothetical protein|nr:hypothetical protein [Puniceicoccales bacterium]
MKSITYATPSQSGAPVKFGLSPMAGEKFAASSSVIGIPMEQDYSSYMNLIQRKANQLDVPFEQLIKLDWLILRFMPLIKNPERANEIQQFLKEKLSALETERAIHQASGRVPEPNMGVETQFKKVTVEVFEQVIASMEAELAPEVDEEDIAAMSNTLSSYETGDYAFSPSKDFAEELGVAEEKLTELDNLYMQLASIAKDPKEVCEVCNKIGKEIKILKARRIVDQIAGNTPKSSSEMETVLRKIVIDSFKEKDPERFYDLVSPELPNFSTAPSQKSSKLQGLGKLLVNGVKGAWSLVKSHPVTSAVVGVTLGALATSKISPACFSANQTITSGCLTLLGSLLLLIMGKEMGVNMPNTMFKSLL